MVEIASVEVNPVRSQILNFIKFNMILLLGITRKITNFIQKYVGFEFFKFDTQK